jgi:thiamine biosynthesis lipoprotein
MTVRRWRQEVMGTVVTFDVVTAQPAEAAAPAVEAAMAWLRWVDVTFSPYRVDSALCRIDRGELAVADAPPEVGQVLDLCDELRMATQGYFDARAGGLLDPSGVVKGWAVERASDLLVAAGWPDHAVDGGGDVRLRGRGPGPGGWRVAVTHPSRGGAFCAVLGLATAPPVATSGIYERGLHVIDPHRGVPATDLAAVTVVGPELVHSDAFATAALAMGHEAPDWLAGLDDHEALVIDASGRGWETPGFGRYRLDAAMRSPSPVTGRARPPERPSVPAR